MKTSCSSWCYHRTFDAGRMDQMSWLDECVKLGLDGVELLAYHFPTKDRDYLRKLKKACSDRFLTIAAVSPGGHLTVSDDKQRAKEVAELGEWVGIASFLGAPRIRFFVGSGEELEAGGRELYDKVLAAVKEVVAFGEVEGIVMAMENHGNATADQLLSLHRDVGNEYFQFTLDVGNFPPHSVVGPHTYPSIERCAGQASIVHAKFFNVGADGRDADFDWERIYGILDKAGFRGFLSVEYEGSDADEVEVMRRIAGYLRALRNR